MAWAVSFDSAEAVTVACALCHHAREAAAAGYTATAACRYRLALRAFEAAGDTISIRTTRAALVELEG
jgi:hypothetical protein